MFETLKNSQYMPSLPVVAAEAGVLDGNRVEETAAFVSGSEVSET